MGREKARRGPRRPRPVSTYDEWRPGRSSSIGDALKAGTLSPQVRQTAMALIARYRPLWQDPETPACGGPLLIHIDGGVECCAGCPGPTEVLHVPEALQFCHLAELFEDSEPSKPCPACTHLIDWAAAGEVCQGSAIDHRDGAVFCSLGPECAGAELPHVIAMSCPGLDQPCDRCR